MQTRNESNIRGIDVSHHQNTIDWLKVAASGVQFAYVKATEGIGYVDPCFRRNAVGAPAAGLKVGFYHYARADTNTAKQDAEHFLATVKGLPSDLPYVLDFENDKAKHLGKAKLTSWAAEWLKIVSKVHPVMFYSYTYYILEYCGAELAQFPLWIAHYNVNQPGNNHIWDKWAAFQYTSQGHVDGISTVVDLNEMDVDFWNQCVKPNDTKAIKIMDGELAYLRSVMQTGNEGQRNWAKQELMKVAKYMDSIGLIKL